MTPHALIVEYLTAFELANPGKSAPTIRYEAGWFKFMDFGGGRNYRRAEFYKMVQNLRQRAVHASPQESSDAR
jgi:hypothetical protein